MRNKHHYSPAEVEGILESAARLDLDVIPLVQSFGHLEFVLKHEEFALYREDADEWLCLCPLACGQTRPPHADPLLRPERRCTPLTQPGIK